MDNNNENTVNIIDNDDENLKALDSNKNTNHDDDIREFMNELRPLYPPLIITPELLMPKLPSSASSTKKLSGGLNNKRRNKPNIKFPNAFIAYRMEFCKQLKNKRICLTMQDVSYFASKLWKKEPCDVKKTYTQLANDAKLLYEKRKKELVLAQEQREQRQQIENEIIIQQQRQQIENDIIIQQQQQSDSTDISSLNFLCSLNSSPFQENKDTQQIFPDLQQHHLIETTPILSQPQISSLSPAISSTQSLYDFPAADPHNVLLSSPYEQPYIYYDVPDLNHRIIVWNLLTN